MTNTESQTKRILNFLLSGGKLTAISALKKFQCFRLASRIYNISQMNKYKIVRETISTKDGKRVVQYSIPV